jgi:hypothetical protein
VILSVIASTVLTAVLAVVIWRMSLTRANNRTIEAIRRAGYPTSKAELNAWYAEVPADKNAALLLTQPMETLRIRSPELQQMKMPGRGERLTNAVLVQAYVETNRATLELIKLALERPQCRYSINLWQGAYADLQHVEPLRDLARLADCAALLAAEGGRSSEAAEHIANIVGLAATLQEEPMLLSQLVRIAILRVAVRRFEHSLSVTKFSETDLSRLARVFAQSARSNCMTRAMIGERARMISTFRASGAEFSRLMSSGGAAPKRPGAEDLILFPLMRISGFIERDFGFYLESMEKIIAQGQFGPPQSLGARDISEDYSAQARRRYCVLSTIYLPGSRTFTREADGLAVVRLAELACAIEKFAKANSRLPQDLAELAPAFISQIPSDPFDGKALRYRRLDDGYLFYSIGADGRDDGGTEPDRQSQGWSKGPEDIVFKVQTPK